MAQTWQVMLRSAMGHTRLVRASTTRTRPIIRSAVPSLAQETCISGNQGHGIYLVNAGAADNVIEGNYIGTNEAGTGQIYNGSDDILLNDTAATRSAARPRCLARARAT